MDEELKKIVKAIKDNKCVLVLGPEICEFKNHIYDGQVPKDFDDSIDIAYQYYINHEIQDEDDKQEILKNPIIFDKNPFAKENFLTVSDSYQVHLYDFMKWYFGQMVDWKIPFTQIAEIPFSLVLSLLPDEYLENTMQEVNKDAFASSHYSRLNKTVNKIEVVHDQTTVLYKLLGSLSYNDATFTFKDWFNFLQSIFKDYPQLPEVIINRIKNAQMFVFVGVRVEKWYIQMLINLLLHIGEVSSATAKIAFVNVKEEQEDKIAKDRLKVAYRKNRLPIPLLADIYNACEKEKTLRASASTPINTKIKTNVFISYNHSDSEIAFRLKKDLEVYGIKIFIYTDNLTGYSIDQFINESIRDADFILQIISKNFLSSAWVAQESIKIIHMNEIMGKEVFPCEIDEVLNDTRFREEFKKKVNSQLNIIENKTVERHGISGIKASESTEDLNPEKNRLLNHKNNYDTIIAWLNMKNRVDLRGNKYESGVAKIIADIQIYQSKIKK